MILNNKYTIEPDIIVSNKIIFYVVYYEQESQMAYGTAQGRIQGGGPWGPGPPPTTKNEAPAPKFYKTEAPEWQF